MQYETEVYHPPTSTKPTSASERDESRLGAAFQILTWVVLGTLMGIWAVVGFVFWMPRMVREMASFSLALVQATMTGADLSPSGDRLKEAIDFYRRGFELAHASIMKAEPRPGSVSRSVEVNAAHLAREALWAVVVWWIVLSVIGATDLTPVALVRWLTSGAWLESLDRLSVGFWGLVDRLTGAAGT